MLVLATLNDDTETLEAITSSDFAIRMKRISCKSRTLQRGVSITSANEEDVLEMAGRSLERHRDPLLVASTQGFYHCVQILYKSGYTFKMYEEDSQNIEQLTKMNHTMASATKYYLYEKMYLGEKTYQNLKSFVRKRIVSNRIADDFDPVERFIRFRAYASPTYLSVAFRESKFEELKIKDPMRKAIACSTYANYLGEYYPQQQEEYQAVGQVCEEYIEDLLDQCQNMDEVKVLLNYSNCSSMDQCENQNWCIALWEKQKELVGHHFFQKFLWDKMTGGDLDWHKYFFHWKFIILFFSLVCLLFSPLVIIADFFRKADILFVPPEARKKKNHPIKDLFINIRGLMGGPTSIPTEQIPEYENDQESVIFAFFRGRFHRPLFRISTAIFFEGIFLLCLTLSLVDPQDKNNTIDWWTYDVITAAFAVLYLFENCMDIYRMKWKYFSSPWNASALVAHVLIVFGFVILSIGFTFMENDRRNEVSGNHASNVGATLTSLGATLSVIRTIRWLRLTKKLGPVVICINKVIKDIFLILVLFIAILLGCSLGLKSMFKPFRHDTVRFPGGMDDDPNLNHRFDTNDNIFSTMFWRFFDPGQPSAAFIYRNKTEIEINKTLLNMECKGLPENTTEVIDYHAILKECMFPETAKISNDQEEIVGRALLTKSLEFSHLMGISLWAAYQFFVVIITVNILIALMNTTYSKLTLRADIEWKYHTAVVYNSFLTPQSVLPPPLRPFYYLACLVYHLMGSNQRPKDERENIKQEYWKLMKKLVRRKTQSDIEKSRDDNFADMRKDVRNTIQNEVVKKLEIQDKANAELLEKNQGLTKKVDDLTTSLSKVTQNMSDLMKVIAKLETNMQVMITNNVAAGSKDD